MDIRKEDFNGLYAAIFEIIGDEVARDIHT